MAYKIVWTDEAKNSFQSIIEYIQYKFPEKAVAKFVTAVDEKVELIKASPTSYRKSAYSNIMHYTNILRKTILVYRIDEEKNIVELIHFWDSRRNPNLMNL